MTHSINGSNPRLVVRRGPTPDKVYVLRQTLTVVGREPLNDVVIPDPELSRRHARIFWEDGSFLIEDLNSTNGTYVNGRRINSKTRLASGDIIDFGETIRVIYEHDIAPTAVNDEGGHVTSVTEADMMLETMAPFPGDRATAKPKRPTLRHKVSEPNPHETAADLLGGYEETTPIDDLDGGPPYLSSRWFLAFGIGFVFIIVVSAILIYLYFIAAAAPAV